MTASTLGPFVIRERVAAGGMGEVWLGEHVEQEIPVAIKVLRPARSADPALVRAFLAEVRAVAGLDHPNVVRVFDFGITPEGGVLPASLPYLVMEWLPRGTVRPLVGKAGWAEIRDTLLGVLDALAHAHARGVVHQDLKPDNVLRSVGGPVLSDFGLAHSLGAEVGATISGTPSYMAPEQVGGDWRALGPWTDLYALGCMAWELVSGEPPFVGDRRGVLRAHVNSDPPALRPLVPVPAGLEGWLRGLLAKNPSDRLQSAAHAAWALRDLGTAHATPEPARATEAAPSVSAQLDTLAFDEALPLPEARPDRCGQAPRPAVPMPRDWRRPGRVPLSPRLLGAGLKLLDLRRPRLVGHEAVRDRLWSLLAETRESGRAAFVQLHGIEGLGKTAIADWLCTRAAELGVAVPVWVSGDVGHGRDAVQEAVEASLRCVGLDAAAVADHLGRLHGQRGVVAGQDFNDLIAWLRPSPGQAPSVPAPVLVYRWLGRLAANGAAIVVLDDGNESPDARALLETAVRVRDTLPAPILFVSTVDPTSVAEGSAAPRKLPGDVIEVSPLSAEEIRGLVGALVPLEPGLGVQLEDASGGNPQLAFAMLRSWAGEELLERKANGFGLRTGRDLPVPSGLMEAWARRLDRVLRGRASPELELAATLGVVVDRAEWAAACAVAGREVPVELVGELAQANLVHGALDERMRFAHPSLAEALRRRAAEAGRLADHHLACATVLRGTPHLERFARHLIAGGAPGEALESLGEAGLRYARQLQFGRAESLYALWFDAAAKAGVPDDDPRVSYLLALRSTSAHAISDPRRARELAEEALRFAERPDHAAAVAVARVTLGRSALHDGDREAAESHLQAALALARRLRQRDTAFDALVELTHADESARARAERGLTLLLEVIDELGLDKASSARAYMTLGAWYLALDDLPRAQRCLEDALTAAEPDQRSLRPRILVYLADLYERAGRAEEGLELYRECYAELRRRGDPFAANPLIYLATVLLERGRFADAHEALSEIAPELVGAADPRLSKAVRTLLVWASAGLGDASEFASNLSRALQLCREVRDGIEPYAWWLHSAAQAARERGLDSRPAYEAALAMFDANGNTTHAAKVRATLESLDRP